MALFELKKKKRKKKDTKVPSSREHVLYSGLKILHKLAIMCITSK